MCYYDVFITSLTVSRMLHLDARQELYMRVSCHNIIRTLSCVVCLQLHDLYLLSLEQNLVEQSKFKAAWTLLK